MDFNRDTSVEEGGGQWKKRRDFFPPNRTIIYFSFFNSFCRNDDDVAKADWTRTLQEDR